MTLLYKTLLISCLITISTGLLAQNTVKGRISDITTKEPIQNATIHCTQNGCNCGCISNSLGEFEMTCKDCKEILITSVGYSSLQLPLPVISTIISLTPSASVLEGIVISANRSDGAKRSEMPIAITTLTNKMLKGTNPTSADQVLNKVSGVNMVNLGNEQHQMSIRQPMTTKSLFLYLEDGIPIRTVGLFNHNALLEMNMTATKSIEVIKGPSSSLYGSEAIGGVVNFISTAPATIPILNVSIQGNNIGYKKADLTGSISKNKWGFVLSGYYAEKHNGFLEYSDYHKAIITGRLDYHFSEKTTLSNNVTWLDYYSDMAGGIDSTMFANRSFKNPQTFTYRKVNAVRYHSTLTHEWKNNNKTTATLLFRNNSISQNPAYRVKDDYRKQGSSFIGKKDLAHGEINSSNFKSYSMIVQHTKKFSWKKSLLIGGATVDFSPSGYDAAYIAIKKDTLTKKYTNYQTSDSILTQYRTRLTNYAFFTNFEFSPFKKLKIVASARYDLFHYNFNNQLPPSAFSGSPDMFNKFKHASPKIGFTYNFSAQTGMYANYSEGFVPPQVSELYTGVKVPDIQPSVFYNYETGGWSELIKNRLTVDISIYKLTGRNEIISVKQDDGSFANQNAGKTSHKGIELGLDATIQEMLSFRFSAAYNKHRFIAYLEKGINYAGNEMNNAPSWIYNTEAWFKPSFIKNLKLGAEIQYVGAYYVDPQNTNRYRGYSVLNLRAAYQVKGIKVWGNLLNATDKYYSFITTKSSSGYSYQLAEPINLNIGVAYDFAALNKKKKI